MAGPCDQKKSVFIRLVSLQESRRTNQQEEAGSGVAHISCQTGLSLAANSFQTQDNVCVLNRTAQCSLGYSKKLRGTTGTVKEVRELDFN
ncbi:hypothetical protein PFLUV_G00055150 [Perca fluviatilis]|uniref:Uncharacterized protein n=1 Tax=Perca fluviatilis TaxID=8168 RepID=A0A6A5FJ51_PERFL|nr:hypothetical protein PFLUV_G00055150 [Perca fluviatilis]